MLWEEGGGAMKLMLTAIALSVTFATSAMSQTMQTDGQYLYVYDDGDLIAKYDLNRGMNRQILEAARRGQIPNDPGFIMGQMDANDPQGRARATFGSMTSMGPCIKGFTVGC